MVALAVGGEHEWLPYVLDGTPADGSAIFMVALLQL
jgi:hypothetical protein